MGKSIGVAFDKDTRLALEAVAEKARLTKSKIVQDLIFRHIESGPVSDDTPTNDGMEIEELPRKGRRSLGFQIGEEASQRLRAERERTGLSMAAIVRRLCREHLDPKTNADSIQSGATSAPNPRQTAQFKKGTPGSVGTW